MPDIERLVLQLLQSQDRLSAMISRRLAKDAFKQGQLADRQLVLIRVLSFLEEHPEALDLLLDLHVELAKLPMSELPEIAPYQEESGQDLAEYGLILAIVAIVAIAVLTTLQDQGVFASIFAWLANVLQSWGF